ncbi:MAG: 3-hydroxybutyryl-CoA dehydrogenase [Bacteroidetes bacterium]|jgi:3-hydroxybutyryl-CoA dehydrogenase|nr:3-hydroxybutyryl-CoA dehydrogenase [Bacteroidota bacterium]
MEKKIEIIGVIGSGTMGIGIAQVAATNLCKVYIYDVNAEQTEKALQQLEQSLQKLAQKEKISFQEAENIYNRIHFCTELKDMKDCQLIIEAIVENKDIKTKVFQELENIVAEDCILASNTSSISITSLSAGLKFPKRFVGIHFFNPAPLMPLVEIIPGLLTQENLANQMLELMKFWKKTPVVAKDIPGFIVNRIARPYYGEALRIVEENIATPQQVDAAMKSIGNFRMGPFELMDLIGIDVNFSVTTTVYKDYFYDPKYKPSLLQQRMSEAKLLGRKTGKGFYDYSENANNPSPTEDATLYQEIFMRIISMLINEAVEAKRLKLASDEDLELAMQKGVNYPKGLLAWGQEIGYSNISQTLYNLYNLYQEERYRQSPLLQKLQ